MTELSVSHKWVTNLSSEPYDKLGDVSNIMGKGEALLVHESLVWQIQQFSLFQFFDSKFRHKLVTIADCAIIIGRLCPVMWSKLT